MECCTGGTHTITLSNEGSVYCFGQNKTGQLGIGEKKNFLVSVPTLIPIFQKYFLVLMKKDSCGRLEIMNIELVN